MIENDETDMIYLSDIQSEKWTFLSFCHKPSYFLSKSEFTLYKDNEQINKNIDYPNLKNQKVMSISFLKDFTGQATSILMSSEIILNNQIFQEFKNFRFGLFNEKSIRIFRDLIENQNNIINSNAKFQTEFKHFIDNLLFIYSPARHYNEKIKDLTDNIDAILETNIENNIQVGGLAINYNYQKNILFLGGFNILLPIFDFFANNNVVTSVLLNESLNLVYKILENGDLNMVKKFFNVNRKIAHKKNFSKIYMFS